MKEHVNAQFREMNNSQWSVIKVKVILFAIATICIDMNSYTCFLPHIPLFTYTHAFTIYSLTQDFQCQKLDSGHSQYIWYTSSLLLGW